ncbi:MAG: hypothetical protein MJ210_03280 [Alphaproteobacteria bacterium]|nr:hypothetical protein [Alphaproteobacteria bacterium]
MTDTDYFTYLDELFYNFEQNIFVNDGHWPRKVNLAFGFSDYIENLSDAEIAAFLKTNDIKKINRFSFLAQQGIEQWFKQNMKTLMI